MKNLDHYIGVKCTIKTFNENTDLTLAPKWHKSPIEIIAFLDNHVEGDKDEVLYKYLDDSYSLEGHHSSDNRDSSFLMPQKLLLILRQAH